LEGVEIRAEGAAGIEALDDPAAIIFNCLKILIEARSRRSSLGRGS